MAEETKPEEEKKEEKKTDSSNTEQKPEKEKEIIIEVKIPEYKDIFPSEIKLDPNLIKKRGFLIALESETPAKQLLNEEIEKIKAGYNDLIGNFSNIQDTYKNTLKNTHENNQKTYNDLIEKQSNYSVRIKSEIPVEKKALTEKIDVVQEDVSKILNAIGKKKEDIVNISLIKVKKEISDVIAIQQETQAKQNQELDKDSARKKDIGKKIEIFEKMLVSLEEQYHTVEARLKSLLKDGINQQTSALLILLGSISALVSGWWFSIWSGPLPNMDPNSNNLGSNTSVKFFFLDNISKFLSIHSFTEIFVGLLIYLVSVGFISWLCYWLRKKYGFISKESQKKKHEGDDSERVDLSEDHLLNEDELSKLRIKGKNWWSVWLRIAPVIFAFVPVLAILSHQIKLDIEEAKAIAAATNMSVDVTTLQTLFDSIINQFIGTCIAFSFSVFTILFFSRITENKFHDPDKNKNKSYGILYIGFATFLLQLTSMFLYHQGIFTDIRKVAIIGFLFGCTATGFSIGFGYLFRSLQENSDSLQWRIQYISWLLTRYSRLTNINYASYIPLQKRLYDIQHAIIDVVEDRHQLAVAIAGGRDYKVKEEDDSDVKVEAEQKTEEPKSTNLFYNILAYFKLIKKLEKERKISDDQKHRIKHSVTNVEMKYFAELAEQLGQLNEKIKELKSQLDNLEKEERDYFKNEGLYRSLNDQIKNLEDKMAAHTNTLAKFETKNLLENKKIKTIEAEEIALLTEGFHTGMWFKSVEDGQKMLIA